MKQFDFEFSLHVDAIIARGFAPVDVETGLEFGGQTEIKRGLKVGQRVVVSSQFLIDSEASLKGVEARLNSEPVPTTELPASGAPR